MFEIKTEKFNGPLDLLLQLIEKEKLEITEISLSQVTEEYLASIESLGNRDAEEMADFLVVAARLLLLKSRAILPVLDDEEVVDDLAKQLKMYKEFIEASKKIAMLLAKNQPCFARQKSVINAEIKFSPGEGLTLEKLKQSFISVLRKLGPLIKIPEQIIARTVSLEQRVLELKDILKKAKKFGFREMMKNAKSKTEVIVNFLAILELLKRRELKVSQENVFDDIVIERI
ncbi:MAG: ScpA family protein [Patescibacteria group bacterium]